MDIDIDIDIQKGTDVDINIKLYSLEFGTSASDVARLHLLSAGIKVLGIQVLERLFYFLKLLRPFVGFCPSSFRPELA